MRKKSSKLRVPRYASVRIASNGIGFTESLFLANKGRRHKKINEELEKELKLPKIPAYPPQENNQSSEENRRTGKIPA